MNFPTDEEVLEGLSSEWKVRRMKCMIIFVVQLFALAIDESIVTLLMPKYVGLATNNSASNSTNMTLLLISSVGSTIVFQLILGRNADTTRRIKRLLVLCNSCSVLGSCIYSIPYGIIVLLIGRFVRGIGTSALVIIIGEVARSYIPKDLCRAVSMCLTGWILGDLLGPIVAKYFVNVDFVVSKLHVRQPNALTLFTSGLFLLVLALTTILASDLSLDFDLKVNSYEITKDRQSREETNMIQSEDDDSSVQEVIEGESSLLFARKPSVTSQNGISSENSFAVYLQLVRNVVILAVIFASSVLTHSELLLRKYGIMMARSQAGIDFRYNSVITTLSVLTRGATFLVVGSIGEKVGDVSLVYAGFALVILSAASWLVMEVVTLDQSAMLSFFVITLAVVCMSSCGEISLLVLMAKLVPSGIQSQSEAFRLLFIMLGLKLADLFYAAELSAPLICATILAGVNIVTIAIINMNYQNLADPKPLLQVNSRKYY